LERTLGVPLFQEQVMSLAMVAAGYTAGEADQLRRDMAAWRRDGKLDQHRERLISGMRQKGIEEEFAERVFQQIRGFGDYGFPESHAASFAVIAYATSYLRKHYPAAFNCSLLNAQPMGFYSAATIIDDAKRHGVVFHPLDVTQSEWHCTMEPLPGKPDFAVRMGMRYLDGMREELAEKIVAARAERAFESLDDFTRRVPLEAKYLSALAESGALARLNGSRRQALWDVRALAREQEDGMRIEKTTKSKRVRFAPLLPFEQVDWDYAKTKHSTRAHPLSFLRDELGARGYPAASALHGFSNDARVSFAGMVICRQRPGTAKEVTFMTLEDETGFANVVIWKRVFDEHELLARTSSFLGVTGTIQNQDGVVHLIAETLWQPQVDASLIELPSRDFH
jgi:error-prone DNA polymerase